MNRTFWQWMAVTMAVVAIVHAIPMAAGYAHRGSTLVTGDVTEVQYSLLINAAYRGESLANPYLAGHENAPRYLPEMVERSLAGLAHLTGLKPLTVVAISRVGFPVGIAVLIAILGRTLGLSEGAAALAALLATLGDPRNLVRVFDPSWLAFPRYFRAVSPGSHVLLFLLALLAVERLRRRHPGAVRLPIRREAKWRHALLAGLALGVLFYTPLFYWTTALAGTAWLALRAATPQRLFLLAAIGIATLGAIPNAVQATAIARDQSFQETLARRALLTPGRAPDSFDGDALRVFCTGAIFLVFAVVLLRKQPAFTYLMPFMTAATLFVVQNVVTNRHLQSHHWVNCLIPLWALIIATWLGKQPQFLRAVPLMFCVVAAVSLATVWVAAARAQARPPALYPLDTMKPQTIDWLRNHTAPGSVIFCAQPYAAELRLFTQDKIYWGGQAEYFALSDAEVATRERDQGNWTPQARWQLHYPADYYLGAAADCPDPLYKNPQENTCIIRIAR